MKTKVLAEDLRLGMFVYELDRPWLDTPFLFQGFLIEERSQIDDLRRYCQFVWVDPAMSTVPVGSEIVMAAASSRRDRRPLSDGTKVAGEGGSSILEVTEFMVSDTPTGRLLREIRTPYVIQKTVEDEIPVARKAHQRASEATLLMFQDVVARGTLDAKLLHESIEEITESVVRNPDALLLLSYLKKKSAYAYDHAVSVSIHLLAFGLHIGLPKPQLHVLGAAGILLNVGMAQLPEELLHKKGRLSESEYALMKTHVELGLGIIQRSAGISPQAAQVVAQHHERENGSGYPAGLMGRDISILGKMAAIVDCFVALISERHYAQPTPPLEALQMLYNWRKDFFHADMVEQFIQCLGPYPVGSLVELNTGEVAVVLAHNRIRRLKPQIMVVLDAEKLPYAAPIQLDLINDPVAFDEQPYRILSSLPDGMYEHNLKDFYV